MYTLDVYQSYYVYSVKCYIYAYIVHKSVPLKSTRKIRLSIDMDKIKKLYLQLKEICLLRYLDM
jgi:hypothetical protein